MLYDGLDMCQISDGLNQTAACASASVYDKSYGLVFVSYMTGNLRSYGESSGKICLSVFSPSQPHNARHRIIDEGVGKSRGVLCTAHYLIGDRRTRMMFTTTEQSEHVAAYYRDYDFETDTVSDRREVFLRTDNGDVPVNNATYREYIGKFGYSVDSEIHPIINKASKYNGEIYTAITLDAFSYAILCKIEDNILIPFAICPDPTTYEFRYFRNDNGIYGVFRVPPDDHKTGHGAYTVSEDGGKTWNTKVYEDGIQSRPDIIEYYGKPLMIYNYKSDKSIENFPNMHNFRNAIKLVYDGEIVLDLFSKYGFVEYDFLSICGDLYMSVCNCPQALSFENGCAWIEDGIPVEQGKEVVQWAKLGYILKNK